MRKEKYKRKMEKTYDLQGRKSNVNYKERKNCKYKYNMALIIRRNGAPFPRINYKNDFKISEFKIE